jgi:hypothetical protein
MRIHNDTANQPRPDRVHVFDSYNDFCTVANTSGLCADFTKNFRGGGSYKNISQVLDAATRGNISLVARSDKLLADFENKLIAPRPSWETIPNVTGGIAVIPDVLSGNPLNMRMRRRTRSALAPLSIVVDLASSGGIDHALCERRGAMALALVRALAPVRPVKLYCVMIGDMYSHGVSNSAVMFPIETAPLDLAHAAHALIHQSVPRGICYELASRLVGANYYGVRWGWQDIDAHRRNAPGLCSRATGEEVYYLPPMHLHDHQYDNPEAWFAKHLTELSEAA